MSRGTMMLFVCLSHAAIGAQVQAGPSRTLARLQLVAMIASPTFVLLSGMLLGLAAAGGVHRFTRFSARLQERGLFLITIGHALMLPAYVLVVSREALPRLQFITDALAVAALLGPWIVSRTTPPQRLALALALASLSWAMVLTQPGWIPVRIGAFAFGTLAGSARYDSAFPVVPWLAWYLVGTCMGQSLGGLAEAGRKRLAASRRLARWAAGLLAAAAALQALDRLLARFPASVAGYGQTIDFVTDARSKSPPSLGYLLLFGGLGLLAVAGCWAATELDVLAPLRAWTAQVGRSSFAVFVMQFYLFFALLPLVPGASRAGLAPFFVASMTLLLLAARLWERIGGNRWIRIPLPRTFGAPAPGLD